MPVIILAVCGVILGFIAYNKNRNYLVWAGIGAFFFLPALLLLLVNNPLCPICLKEINIKDRRNNKCSKCGANVHFRFSGKIIEHRGAIVLGGLILLIAILYIVARVTNYGNI